MMVRFVMIYTLAAMANFNGEFWRILANFWRISRMAWSVLPPEL
jgi:hypothetical protein